MNRRRALSNATAGSDAGALVPRPSEPILVPSPRGHGPKIDEAIAALKAAGQLMAGLRSSERDRRISDWLHEAGYCGEELPSRWAIWRHLRARRDRRR